MKDGTDIMLDIWITKYRDSFNETIEYFDDPTEADRRYSELWRDLTSWINFDYATDKINPNLID